MYQPKVFLTEEDLNSKHKHIIQLTSIADFAAVLPHFILVIARLTGRLVSAAHLTVVAFATWVGVADILAKWTEVAYGHEPRLMKKGIYM